MNIYNLFPLLAGKFSDWKPHLERAADLGFDSIFVNPIQYPGFSGSLYSIKDYFRLHHLLIDESSSESPEEQFRKGVVEPAGELGLDLIVDLVISHCAFDSDLIKDHPQWFVQENGQVAHPFCMEGNEKVVWRDLAQFDHEHSSQKEELFQYCLKVVRHLVKLGFRGFRCDAAYQIPKDVWERLIREIRKDHPETYFLAETLGCTPDKTIATASAGFDYIFNSSKWWDFHGSWLMEQYALTRDFTRSISFPESHDTPRLNAEAGGNLNVVKQRTLFSCLFSAGVMIPVGFEYGFHKPLHVVDSRPEDWETPSHDFTGFIRNLLQLRAENPLFQTEAPTEILECSNPNVLFLWKGSVEAKQEALIILNKDPYTSQHVRIEDIYRHVQSQPPLIDLSPEHRMDFLATPFEYELRPGQGIVLVTPAPAKLKAASPVETTADDTAAEPSPKAGQAQSQTLTPAGEVTPPA